MKHPKMEDYLEKGLYGPKQTMPEERKKFLGTIRERVVVALTKSQVMETGVYPEVEKCMNEHPKAFLLLNGTLNYSFLSDYIKKAREKKIPFSIVSNKDSDTDIGLVLAYHYAIDKEEIYIKRRPQGTAAANKKKTPLSFIKQLLKRK